VKAASIEQLPVWARELIERHPIAHLGLLDSDDRPRVMPVTFAVCAGEVWSAVDHKPKRAEARELARVRWLRRNPAAALTVDRYSDHWERLAWVQALGEGEVLDEPAPGVLDALKAKYEQYRERPPAGPFLRLRPARVLWWSAAAGAGSAEQRDS
jgi:PPOX class probable F420-dependent enzyme